MQPLGLYLIIFFTVWSIERLFKDRTVGLWQVKDADALPVPVWVTLPSRFLAMARVAFVCSVCLLVIGVLVQLGRYPSHKSTSQATKHLKYLLFCRIYKTPSVIVTNDTPKKDGIQRNKTLQRIFISDCF